MSFNSVPDTTIERWIWERFFLYQYTENISNNFIEKCFFVTTRMLTAYVVGIIKDPRILYTYIHDFANLLL